MRVANLLATMMCIHLIQLGLGGCAKTGVFQRFDTENSEEPIAPAVSGSESDGDSETGTDYTSDTAGNSDEDPDTMGRRNDDSAGDSDDDSGLDSDRDTNTYMGECAHISAKTERMQPRVMILQDRSSSMNRDNKWAMATTAIATVVNTYNNRIWFGLDLFSSPLVDNDALCTVGDSPILDVAPQNADAIVEHMAQYEPARSTPLLRAMHNYSADLEAGYASEFQTGGSDNSTLILVSDGQDTCGLDGVWGFETGATTTQLADAADTLLKYYGIQTVAIGLGDQVSPESLNAIAASGGSAFSEYIQTDSGEALKEALDAVATELTARCDYSVVWSGSTAPPPEVVEIWLNDQIIPESDSNCSDENGWFWSDADAYATITLCRKSCAIVNESDSVVIELRALCSTPSIPDVE